MAYIRITWEFPGAPQDLLIQWFQMRPLKSLGQFFGFGFFLKGTYKTP